MLVSGNKLRSCKTRALNWDSNVHDNFKVQLEALEAVRYSFAHLLASAGLPLEKCFSVLIGSTSHFSQNFSHNLQSYATPVSRDLKIIAQDSQLLHWSINRQLLLHESCTNTESTIYPRLDQTSMFQPQMELNYCTIKGNLRIWQISWIPIWFFIYITSSPLTTKI